MVNVEICVLYMFLRYSCFLNSRENIYIVKITFTMPFKSYVTKICEYKSV